MLKKGEILGDKYEILKEIGHGGMSRVYLATDTHINRQWAVKEVTKNSNKNNSVDISNGLIVEADMLRRLNHPALPRIVDIIEDDFTICIVMDYIEGESLDKVLKEGVQSENDVLEWAKQLCDALTYLHSQNPPIIYRDMKPSNVILKPDGKVSIIDFGIAMEYKEGGNEGAKRYGTNGYFPPEQKHGQADARSDIYALGKTMFTLLTNCEPTNEDSKVPVRCLRPDLSEGVEMIIEKCRKENPEERYQDCKELMKDLENPTSITKGYKRSQKRKLHIFEATVALAVFFAFASLFLHIESKKMNNDDYEFNLASSDPLNYYNAVAIYPERPEAYNQLIEYYKSYDALNEDIIKVGNAIESNSEVLDLEDPAIADMYYDMGKLYFSDFDGPFKTRAINAKNFFKIASDAPAEYDKKAIANCYYSICKFMTNQSTTKEHSLADYQNLFAEIENAMKIMDDANDSESNYDKISLYYVTTLLINDQAEYMAGVGVERSVTLRLLEKIHNDANRITSTLTYVNNLKTEINRNYPNFENNINAKYNEVQKRQQGGNEEWQES